MDGDRRRRPPRGLRHGGRHRVPVHREAQARLERHRRLRRTGVRRPRLLRYSWTDHGGGETTEVTYHVEPHTGGTRFTYDHTGFTGAGGLIMSQVLGRVRRKMLTVGLPAVLDDMDEEGGLRQRSALRPGS